MINFRALKTAIVERNFVRNVIVLGSGNAGAQVISILVSPILTRLYSTYDFGLLAVFSALLNTIGVISGLRYELAIPIEKDDKEAIHIVFLTFSISLLVALLTLFLVTRYHHLIAIILNMSALDYYLWLLPPSLIMLNLHQLINYWTIRENAFLEISQTRILQSISSVLVKMSAAEIGFLSLIIGDLIGQILSFSYLLKKNISKKNKIFRISRGNLYLVAKKYRKFPIFATWDSLLSMIGSQMPSILFAAYFDPAAAGFYALSHRFISLPMQLIGQAIRDVFFSKAAEALKEGKVDLLTASVHKELTRIAMMPVLLLSMIGPDLFQWIFGVEWREAGVFVRLMTPVLYLQFVFSPTIMLFHVLEKQEKLVILQSITLMIRFSALFVGAKTGDLRTSVSLFSFASSISYVIFLIFLMRISGNKLVKAIIPSINSFIHSVPIISPVAISTITGANTAIKSGAVALTLFLMIIRYSIIAKNLKV
ncbi:MAG: lipopolysaccharide biosynthesis protein [Leptolyngbyaceae cyanobacterium]